jgi:Rieske Fe-S protein
MTTTGSSISRRRALHGAATAGLGLPLLAACGEDGDGGGTAADPSDPSGPPEPSEPASSSSAPKTTGRKSSEPPVDGIPASDVPVGGGIVLAEEETVLTQPTEGEFRAFTAICTHAQCLVTSVSDGTIHCPCHGSQYSIEDGSVTGGPAPAALAEVDLTVHGDRIVLG